MAGDEGMHLDVLETPQRVRSSLAVAITVRGPPCPTQTPSNVALAVAHDLVSRDFRLMENWGDEEASAIIGLTMHNDESVGEPRLPASQAPLGLAPPTTGCTRPTPSCAGPSTASSPRATGRSRRRRCPAARPDLS